MLRVRRQSALGVIRRLLCAFFRSAALLVHIGCGFARLCVGLLLGLGGLAAGVGCGHGGWLVGLVGLAGGKCQLVERDGTVMMIVVVEGRHGEGR